MEWHGLTIASSILFQDAPQCGEEREWSGLDRTGSDRKGMERKGKEWSGSDGIGKPWVLGNTQKGPQIRYCSQDEALVIFGCGVKSLPLVRRYSCVLGPHRALPAIHRGLFCG